MSRELPKTILQFFWDLAGLEETTRLQACTQLLTSLLDFQRSFESDQIYQTIQANANNNDENTMEYLEQVLHRDVMYALRRLVKGLQSGRLAARQGFCVALTELIRQIPAIHYQHIRCLVDEHMKFEGNMKGQDRREVLFGRIFACTAMINAGLLQRESTTLEDVKDVVGRLAEDYATKDFLRELVTANIKEIVQQTQHTPQSEAILEKIVDSFLKKGIRTTDQLCIAFITESSSKAIRSAMRGWATGELVQSENLSHLRDAFIESSACHPRTHLVWGYIIAKLMFLDQSPVPIDVQSLVDIRASVSPAQQSLLQQFWRTVVDDGLFHSTPERKFLGFRLFQLFTHYCHDSSIPLMFTPNFLRCFLQHLSSKDNLLYGVANETTLIIQKLIRDHPTIAFHIVSLLLGPNGSRNFDEITNTTTVKSLVSSFTDTSIIDYIDFLKDMLFNQSAVCTKSKENHSSEDIQRYVHRNRIWAVDALVHIPVLCSITISAAALDKIAEILIYAAYFASITTENQNSIIDKHVKKKSKKKANQSAEIRMLAMIPEINEETRTALNSRLWQFVINCSVMTTQSSQSQPITISPLMATENSVKRVFNIIKRIAKDPQWSFAQKMTPMISTLYGSICSTVDAIEAAIVANETCKNHLAEEMTGVLTELIDCRQRVFDSIANTSGVSKSRKAEQSPSDEECEPEPVEVIMDILLSFLAKPSALLRKLSEQVFRVFCDQMTVNGLDLFLDIVRAKEDISGQQELFGDEDDDEEVDDEDSDDDEDEDEQTEEIDEEFRRKLEEALGSAKANNEDDSDMESLGDDDMVDFDARLTAVFKQKKVEKTAKRDTRTNIVHFKYRVLDLLSLFVRRQSNSPLMLNLLSALLVVATDISNNAESQPLSQKLNNLLQSILKSKDYPHLRTAKLDQEHIEFARDTLDKLFQRASAVPTNVPELQRLGRAISYIVKCLQLIPAEPSLVAPVIVNSDEFGELITGIFTKAVSSNSSKIIPHLIEPMITQHPLLIGRYLLTPMLRCLQPDAPLRKMVHINNICKFIKNLLERIAGLKHPELPDLLDRTTSEATLVFTKTLDKLIDNKDGKFKVNHIRDNLSIISQMIRLSRKRYGIDYVKQWPVSDIENKCMVLDSVAELNKSIQNLLNSLLNMLSSSYKVGSSKTTTEKQKSPRKRKGENQDVGALPAKKKGTSHVSVAS